MKRPTATDSTAQAAGQPRAAAASLELFETRVSENIEIAPGVRLLTYPRTHDFIPGQVVGITVDRRIVPRYYSIASGADEPFVDILYDVLPEGELTPLLAQLQSGDLLLVSRATGGFLDTEQPGWWIATGTGIAPFVSMAKSGLAGGKRLVHGSRTLAGFHFRKYFTKVLSDRYTCCCTQESGPGVFAGRLTQWLAQQSPPADERYLLCGSAGMVVDVRDLLIAKGVPFAQVLAEIYF